MKAKATRIQHGHEREPVAGEHRAGFVERRGDDERHPGQVGHAGGDEERSGRPMGDPLVVAGAPRALPPPRCRSQPRPPKTSKDSISPEWATRGTRREHRRPKGPRPAARELPRRAPLHGVGQHRGRGHFPMVVGVPPLFCSAAASAITTPMLWIAWQGPSQPTKRGPPSASRASRAKVIARAHRENGGQRDIHGRHRHQVELPGVSLYLPASSVDNDPALGRGFASRHRANRRFHARDGDAVCARRTQPGSHCPARLRGIKSTSAWRRAPRVLPSHVMPER